MGHDSSGGEAILIAVPDHDPKTSKPFTKNGLRRYLIKQRKKAALAVVRAAEHEAKLKWATALRTTLHRRVGFPSETAIAVDDYQSIPVVHAPEPVSISHVPVDFRPAPGGGCGECGCGDGSSSTRHGKGSILDQIFVRTPAFQQKNGACFATCISKQLCPVLDFMVRTERKCARHVPHHALRVRFNSLGVGLLNTYAGGFTVFKTHGYALIFTGLVSTL
jgi:hypothetical protein